MLRSRKEPRVKPSTKDFGSITVAKVFPPEEIRARIFLKDVNFMCPN